MSKLDFIQSLKCHSFWKKWVIFWWSRCFKSQSTSSDL